MFNKNSSPSLLSAIGALTIAGAGCLLVGLFSFSLIKCLIAFVVLFILVYSIMYYLLQYFVQGKIKLIYRFIAQTKATKREEFYINEILPPKTIEEVNKEVAEWAIARDKEIESFETNEQFRKDFLLNLTHELKTPIFAAQNYVETLIDGAMDNKAVSQTFLEKASKSINRLVLLVEDLDEISKYESNEMVLKKENFVIQHLIKEVFEELQFKQAEKNIKFGIKPGCEKGIMVLADSHRIKQVLINLVENSIKYGKENGETLAGIYNIDGKSVLVEINDNGYGIAEEHIPRIFERFYRTDLARSRKVGGTGLGLSIVKHIIEAHHGSIHCRSKIDIGATIGFTLQKGS